MTRWPVSLSTQDRGSVCADAHSEKTTIKARKAANRRAVRTMNLLLQNLFRGQPGMAAAAGRNGSGLRVRFAIAPQVPTLAGLLGRCNGLRERGAHGNLPAARLVQLEVDMAGKLPITI